ncbi:glycoside hydrolase family 172 protein [Niabella yanshanensis]|uniref:Glycoside hydrolase family 172 protein n=1 Tax=Niabella yanshanensis TaxID=577386 RepID=A0ABZ0W5E1_9BACT|nr:glycoside hydrolase family 172 protein [Niabella yanshanensis]WQD36737.1 glycoside hydrolase family 172 protein [Niabella yanshanensis]
MKFIITVFLFIGSLIVNAQKVVNFQSELRRLSDISLLPQYLDGTVVKQVSSYDRTGGNDDGFSGKYSFIRKEKEGLVILDAQGSGVIERIWTPTPTNDTLDFYFDGSSKPGLSIRFNDLFSGKVAPFLKPLVDAYRVGGYYCYVPIPYAKSCKIIFRGEKIMFHQVQYREYNPSYKVETFNLAGVLAQKNLLRKVANLWSDENRTISNFKYPGIKTIAKEMELMPGESTTIARISSGGRITGIELDPPAIFNGLYKQADIKITWDDETAPAVYVPVADFFGYAFGQRAMESLLVGATKGKLYSYIPMPFEKSATIALEYRKLSEIQQEPLRLRTLVHYTAQKKTASEGRFYAKWAHDEPANGQSYVFLEGKGKGHYIGTILQAQGRDYNNFTEFFEGDDQTYIDGELRLHGTGSEDYFNGGWYAQPGGWTERAGAALSGCTDYSIPLSRTGGYRFFLSDKMPFSKEIKHTIEHGPVNNRPVTYSSVAMYYANKAIAVSEAPSNTFTKVSVPDTLTFYTNFLKHITYNGGIDFKDGHAIVKDKDNNSITINVNEVPDGRYALYLNKVDAGINKISVRIADVTKIYDWRTVDLQAGKKDTEIYLGDVDIKHNTVPVVPVNIMFRSDAAPELIFNRMVLRKK